VKVYADTSFLASLYAADSHSAEAQRRVRLRSPEFFLTPLLELELMNALQLRVFRREASSTEARKSGADLESDIRDGLFTNVPVTAQAYETAQRVAQRQTASIGTRTLDILHVACAVLLKADRFWTFDERQAALARAEGLRVR
jgi:predicted nucleic acid-binding protein